MTEIDPKQALEQEISVGLTQLRRLLATCSTHSLAGWCYSYHLKTAHGDDSEKRLTSPAKQISFLLGVLVSGPEPAQPKEFGETDWKRVKSLLERLFSAYMLLYMPTKDQLGKHATEWFRVRKISMLAFLHYFNNGLLASIEQIIERVKVYLVPFDNELSEIIGISASQSLAICRWISDTFQEKLDTIYELTCAERDERVKLIEMVENGELSFEAFISAAQTQGYRERIEALFSRINDQGIVLRSELERAFPETAGNFWQQFSVRRGDGPEIRYPTEESVYEARPLIEIRDNEAFCPVVNGLFTSLLLVGERTLLKSPARKKFLRARDKALEAETLKIVRTFLSPSATIWSEVYETPDSHFEHDIIAIDEGLCLVIEAKAAPPIEPFRDPDKAFIRLRDAFRADTGIQKAYEQANRIVRKLKDGAVVPLYDVSGCEIGRIFPDSSKLPIAVCVTRDNFGALATDLSLLLEKEEDAPYPWAINILDFSNLADAWSYFKWGTSEFRDFLQQRLRLHGKVFSDDELDYVGYFMRHGGFESAMKAQADLFQLNPDYSSIFDEVYRHLYLGGPPVTLERTEPVIMDLKRSIIANQPVFLDLEDRTASPRKIGRNEPCPCGSGKKYKRCCGTK